MKKYFFCIASLLLVTFALSLDFGGKSQFTKGMNLRARSATLGTEQREHIRAEASVFSDRGRVLVGLGMGFAVASLICLVASFRNHEAPWWRSAPVALLLVYVMMQFMLV